METTTKWLVTSIIFCLLGFGIVFFLEGISSISGEFNHSILLTGIISTIIFILISFISLIKANINFKSVDLSISIFIFVLLLIAITVDGLFYTIYFIEK